MRSAASANSAAARNGKTITTSRLVTSMFHVKIGMRNMVMPGARSVRIVVIRLTAPRMVPRPDRARPTTHMFAPTPGLWMPSDSGV